jgi:hypothetical protein
MQSTALGSIGYGATRCEINDALRSIENALLTSNTGNGFTTSKIGNMHKSVVEGGIDMGYTKDQLALTNLWAEGNGLLSSDLLLSLLGLQY